MKKFFLLLLFFSFFIGCSPADNYVQIELKGDGKNTCLVDAFVYKSAYDTQTQLKSFTWSKILLIEFKNTRNDINGHAMTIFIINTQRGFQNPKYDHLYVFDRLQGSREVPLHLKNAPYSLATYLYGADKVNKAYYLE